MYEEYKEHTIAVFGGYLQDENKLLESSSGGIATAISEYVIDNGGCVAGVAYDSSFRKAGYILVDNLEDLQKLKGSKYIEVELGDIFQRVQSLLKNGVPILFFGLPCIVAALYKTLHSTDTTNLITCEFICHGHTTQKVHEEYIAHIEQQHHSKVIDFSVRHKIGEWTPLYLYAKFSNGKELIKPFYETEYGYAFANYTKLGCYKCKFRGNNRTGDIMLGDFWGATSKDEFWNPKGVSVVIVHSEKGLELLKTTPGIKLFETTFERAVAKNINVIKQRQITELRDKFDRLYQKRGLFYAANHTESVVKRCKKAIKKLVPKAMLKFLKKQLGAHELSMKRATVL